MTDTVHEHARVGRDVAEALLETKLSPPPIKPNFVSHRNVIAEARSTGCRAIGITAPAGYGKSTLMAEWAQLEDRPLAWVSLDRFDDDPTRFLITVASAYARMDPSWSHLVAEMSGPGVSTLGRTAPRLAAALASAKRPFVLLLDDLHELRSAECLDVLELVMIRFPSGSQLVSSSRSEQRHLSRLRTLDDVVEIGVDELSLDESGAREIFQEAHVQLTPDRARAVTRKTEGWPVGLQLAALIARDSKEQESLVAGDDRYVADYLYGEVLLRQPEDLQRFLRRTAVLEKMCGPLCDDILGTTDATQQLRVLEASGLFVVALDRRRQWYRYHALFREFLLSELRRCEAGESNALHVRAADWYMEQGSPDMALEHLLQTTADDRTAHLLSAMLQPAYQSGNFSTGLRWLESFGERNIQGFPPLAVHAGLWAVYSGDTISAERWAAFLETASYTGDPADGSASFDSLRAQLRVAMCPLGPTTMLADAEFAVEQESVSTTYRHNALWSLAEAHLLLEGGDAARPVFVEASKVALESGAPETFVLSESELGILAMDEGWWEEAGGHLERALGTVDEWRMHDYINCSLAFAGGARLSLHKGQLDQARAHLAQATRNRHLATYVLPVISVRLRIQIAKVYVALGDVAAARQLVRESDEIVMRRPELGTLIDQLGELREMLRTSEMDPLRLSILTPAEIRLLPYLQTHLSIAEIGQRLGVSRNTANTQISSIYRKLGVSSRGDAVERAIARGLLGD